MALVACREEPVRVVPQLPVAAPSRDGHVVLPSGVTAPASFADLAERCAPAVVFIRTHQTRRYGSRRVVGRALGSGFLVTGDGLIVSNHHVVEGAAGISVALADGQQLSATLVASDGPTDIALLKVEADELPHLTLGDSDAVRVGDWVMAIGNPFGLRNTVSAGIVSAKERTSEDVQGLDPEGFYSFLQTDASINPGNSGGPLLSLAGQVIGVNTALNVQAHKIGYAIPSNRLRDVLPRLMADGEVKRSGIGAVIAAIEEVDVGRLGLSGREGALVREVVPKGPAAQAGLLPDDVVVAFNGKAVKTPEELRWVTSLSGVGRRVSLTVWRAREKHELTVWLGMAPSSE